MATQERLVATKRNRVTNFYRADRFTQAAWLAGPLLIIFFLLFLVWVLPQASADSVRYGLMMVAVLLAIVIAAELGIIWRFIDQRAQAESLFAKHFDFFRGLIQKNGSIIQGGREQFMSWLLAQPNGSLQDLAPTPSDCAELKRCITALSSLSAAVGTKDFDKIASPLKALGYDLDEIMEMMGQSQTLGRIAPYDLFDLLTAALLYVHNMRVKIWNEALARFFDFTQSTLIAMNQEGLIAAVRRYQAMTAFLGSWTLPYSLALNVVVLLLTILIMFGLNERSASYPVIAGLIYVCVFGFAACMVLLGLTFRSLFSSGK